ncbi:MAG: TrkH family potassium uptake protein [Aristaeellaceae bacterium]
MQERKPGLMQRTIRPEQVLAVGFLTVILLGTALLALPIATIARKSIGLFDALFTATSAVCVTGLVAVDTGTTFSMFGQVVLLGLIQLGGLGFMIFATLVMLALGRRITLRDRMLIRESVNASTLSGLLKLTIWYGLITLVIEGAGALLLAMRMIPRFGWDKGLWYAVFHSVSAFCNAGFDLFGNFSSLTGFDRDPVVLLTVSALIILGGLGFAVMLEVWRGWKQGWRGFSLHTKVVLVVSAGLVVTGTVFYALVEWNNPDTLAKGEPNGAIRLLNAFFQSVTMRTAGFNSIDLAQMKESSKLLSVILMFIGASPASTGGGVKTTTVSVLLLIVLSVVRGQEEVNVFGKRLPKGLMRRALSILFIYLMLLLSCTMLLTLAEQDGYPFIDLLFESASALATVGVSTIGTPQLTVVSRLVLIPVMYFGRVGPLTLAFALANKQNNTQNRLRYPEESMMIG